MDKQCAGTAVRAVGCAPGGQDGSDDQIERASGRRVDATGSMAWSDRRRGVGTLEWAQRTNGLLRFRDRVQWVWQALLQRWQLGVRRQDGRALRGEPSHASHQAMPLSTPALPCSPAARAAQAHLRLTCAPWLVHHALRSYAWAALLAQARRIKVDHDLLFVAGAMRACALADQHPCAAWCAGCMAVEGGRAALGFCAGQGWAPDRARRCAEAIVLHLNLQVPVSHGAEAHLLHAAVLLDLTGEGVCELAHHTVQGVLACAPPLELMRAMPAAMHAEARRNPAARMALLVRQGLAERVGQGRWGKFATVR